MVTVGDMCSLTITGVVVKMTGNYRCVAKNSKGTVEHSALITITDGKEPEKKPVEKLVETKPVEENIPETEPVAVEQIEEAKAQFVLEKSTEEVQQAEASLVMITTTTVEEDAQAQIVMEQPIEAAPEKPVEAAPEKPADTGAPKFVEVYEEMTFLEKKTLTLTVKITGKPAPEVQWFR